MNRRIQQEGAEETENRSVTLCSLCALLLVRLCPESHVYFLRNQRNSLSDVLKMIGPEYRSVTASGAVRQSGWEEPGVTLNPHWLHAGFTG